MKATRGFQKITKEQENKAVLIPQRATMRSIGYDFFSPYELTIPAQADKIIHTGIKAYFQADEGLFLYPRSSHGIKKNLRIKNTVGVIDADYYNNPKNEGEILVCLQNLSQEPVHIKQGEKICQGVFHKILLSDDEVEHKRKGGVGSTGN